VQCGGDRRNLPEARHLGGQRSVPQDPGHEGRRAAVGGAGHLGARVVAEEQPGSGLQQECGHP